MFGAFVRANRSPTGQTVETYGRCHGAPFYLDSNWVRLRNNRANDTRASLSSSFNEALMAAARPKLHCRLPLRWLWTLFGSTKPVDGSYVASDEHTTLYLHKTDACSTCELFHGDIRTAKQSHKRHKQQSDQASILR